MTSLSQLDVRVAQAGATLAPKAGSVLMLRLDRAFRCIGQAHFLDRFWTTWGSTIYYPTSVEDPWAHPSIIAHELVHVAQWRRWGPLFLPAYALLPLPAGLAYCRWHFEREAYRVDLAHAPDPALAAAHIADKLWREYAYPWPRPLMRRWLVREASTMAHAHTTVREKSP